MPYEVDASVALPPPSRQGVYPFADLALGESFFVPLNGESRLKVQRRLSVNGSRRPGRFVTRSLVEDGVPGIRVWRAE